ncbi:MAG: DUF1611 domain-containing protein [Micrococcus sp.]|nr:DUF1611 domain-containing protein [Micrococcus sp.]
MTIAPVTLDSLTRPTDAAAPAHAGLGPLRRLPVPAHVQASYTTRFVAERLARQPERFHLLAGADVVPQAGTVVIARVTEILQHKRIETPESRKAILFQGAVVMLAYGHRYAADQFLAEVPNALGPCHLVAAGGLAGWVTAQHAGIDEPTRIEPLGILADENGPVHLADAAPCVLTAVPAVGATQAELDAVLPHRPPVIAVLGTSMNSGKSTAMACLINGLTAAGLRVNAGKATGTGAGNDPMLYVDAGAREVRDFTDFGHPTTFRLDLASVRALTVSLIDVLSADRPDVVVVEIADGVYQGETAALLADPLFQASVDGVLFSATDALGAVAGVSVLESAGMPVLGVSGVLTSSPLATLEAREVLSVPVEATFDLTYSDVAVSLMPGMRVAAG